MVMSEPTNTELIARLDAAVISREGLGTNAALFRDAKAALEQAGKELAEARADAERWKRTWLRSDEAGEKHANGFLEERCAEAERADAAEQKLTEQAATIERALAAKLPEEGAN